MPSEKNQQNAAKLSEDHFLTVFHPAILKPRDEQQTTMALMAFW